MTFLEAMRLLRDSPGKRVKRKNWYDDFIVSEPKGAYLDQDLGPVIGSSGRNLIDRRPGWFQTRGRWRIDWDDMFADDWVEVEKE